MLRKKDLQKQITAHYRRLQILRELQAKQGLETPPSVIIEIKDIEEEIEKIEAALELFKEPKPEGKPVSQGTYRSGQFLLLIGGAVTLIVLAACATAFYFTIREDGVNIISKAATPTVIPESTLLLIEPTNVSSSESAARLPSSTHMMSPPPQTQTVVTRPMEPSTPTQILENPVISTPPTLLDTPTSTLPPSTSTPIPPTPTQVPTSTPIIIPTSTNTPIPAPVINKFTADRFSINAGENVVLSWELTHATVAYLRHNDTEETINASSGSVTVSPTNTTNYTIVARSDGGEAIDEVSITVVDSVSPPPCAVSSSVPLAEYKVILYLRVYRIQPPPTDQQSVSEHLLTGISEGYLVYSEETPRNETPFRVGVLFWIPTNKLNIAEGSLGNVYQTTPRVFDPNDPQNTNIKHTGAFLPAANGYSDVEFLCSQGEDTLTLLKGYVNALNLEGYFEQVE